MSVFDLAGRKALVTGGARGLGAGMAEALARAGAAVVIGDIREELGEATADAIKKTGADAAFLPLDVTNETSWERAIEGTIAELGGLDILVNNAGLVMRQRFSESTPEDWKKQIDTCLYGALNCSHSAGPLLEASGRGRVISIMGDSSRVGESGLALAAAARAGTIALMKSLAREWGRSGVTANSISLGLIETSHDKTWVDANRDKLVRAYAIRRLGLPSDVAPLVTLLASDAGGWITGQVISVNGGYSMV
jgi:3-oxoacyl-[acyl-carrier protein] reductase